MRLMMDVVQYVDLTGIAATHTALGAAIHEIESEFAKKPFELRVGKPVANAMLRIIEQYGVSVARIDEDGRVAVFGIPLKILPDSYSDQTVLAIMSAETHFAGEETHDA